MSNIQKSNSEKSNSEAQDKTAIVQAGWEKLRRNEGKVWESAWPAAYRPAFVGFAAGVRALLIKEPRLLNCPDLAVRLVECAGLGLLPHWGPRGEAIVMYAHSQKYGPQAALVVGYRGYEAAWYRDGIIVPGKLKVGALMPEDRWEYEETEEGTRFRWAPNHSVERSYERMLLVFARGVLREGGCAVGIRLKAKCDKVKGWAEGKVSPAYGAWPLEMAMKGAIMELKRELPFAENTERLLEYESQHGDPEERDMGEAQRVDLGAARPITVSASLPEPRSVEVIEPAVEREAVPVERQATKPGRIIDESTDPDPAPTWGTEDEARMYEWENSTGEIPVKSYRVMYDAVQRMRGTSAYAKLSERLTALAARQAKKNAPAAANDEPGRDG